MINEKFINQKKIMWRITKTMININEDLAVQSFCFRNFKDNKVVAEKVKQLGLSKIELCGVHADFDNEDEFEGIINTYQDAGIEIVSIGVESLANNPEKEKSRFEFLKKAGAKYMSVDFNPNTVPESIKTAENLAEEYDIKLSIHNHGGRHWLGNSQILETIFNKTGDSIGLCLDTAWALDAGEDPLAMAKKFQDRLYGIHFKDFNFDQARNHEDVVVGTGNLDLTSFFNFPLTFFHSEALLT
jgi:sugar phosphate isomerase/epimerase